MTDETEKKLSEMLTPVDLPPDTVARLRGLLIEADASEFNRALAKAMLADNPFMGLVTDASVSYGEEKQLTEPHVIAVKRSYTFGTPGADALAQAATLAGNPEFQEATGRKMAEEIDRLTCAILGIDWAMGDSKTTAFTVDKFGKLLREYRLPWRTLERKRSGKRRHNWTKRRQKCRAGKWGRK
jgi:hypothetical protein